MITATGSALKEKALRSMLGLPAFSPVLNRLLATLGREDASISTIADIIQKDTVIAGNILKLVNSAMYGRRGVVTSLTHASSLLGLNRLRNAVLGMSVSRMWNQAHVEPGWSTARFNLHAVATALLADLLAQRVPVEFPEGAFLAGLFHDVGKLICAVGLKDEHASVVELHGQGGRTWVECEREVLGFTHAELSAGAIERWKLPAPIREAARHHHDPEFLESSVPLGTRTLALVVHCADEYVKSLGLAVEKEADPAAGGDPFGRLAIRDGEGIVEEFNAEYDALTVFFR